MGFTITGVGLVPRIRGNEPLKPVEVTVQSKHPVSASGKPGRGSRAPRQSTLDDRIRTGNRWAPKSILPKESMGPSDRDRLRGIGPARATSAVGWFVHGPTRDEVTHREETVLAIVGKEKFADVLIGKDEHGKPIWERRFWEDTRIVEVTREQAVRMNAWIPPGDFMSVWTPREA